MIPDEIQPGARGIGDNSMSMRESAIAELRAELHVVEQEGGKTFAERRDEFLATAERVVVRDRFEAGDAGDVIKLAGEVREMIERKRFDRSNPFRETANALKGVADEFWQPVDTAMKSIADKIDGWSNAEKKLVAQQRAEQEQMLAELGRGAATPAPTAAPIPARRAPIRGMLGSTVTQVDHKTFAIEDISLVPEYILNSETVRAAIIKVAAAMSRHMGAIPGISVTTTAGTTVR